MTIGRTTPSPSISGPRALEMAFALLQLERQLSERRKEGPETISTVGTRTLYEQECLGMAQILMAMYPLAVELALKSLSKKLHRRDEHQHTHKLDELFFSLTRDAKDVIDAREAQQEARDIWSKWQDQHRIKYKGTLEEFLKDHTRDFVDIRYYDWGQVENYFVGDLLGCFFCIVFPLSSRDPDTKFNLDVYIESLNIGNYPGIPPVLSGR